MLGEDHLAAFLAARERRGDRPMTTWHAGHAVRGFYAWWKQSGLPLDRLDAGLLDGYRQHLYDQDELARSTQYVRLSALRTFVHFLATEGVLPSDPSELVVLPKQPRSIYHVLSERELVQLCQAVRERDPAALRDRAFLEVLVATAMRPSEAAHLRIDDIKLRERRVRIRRGKGDRLRWLPLTRSAVRALRSYLAVRRQIFAPGVRSDLLFVSAAGTFEKNTWPAVVARAAAAAGLEGHITPYTIRHSVATALVRAGVELRHLQALLGHSRTQSTEVYLHLGPQDLKRAHERAHPRERNRRDPRAKRRL